MASCNPFSSIKMNYFPIQGAAEPARLALVLGEIPFEDARLDRPAMTAMTEAGELPYGQLPTLVVDGKTIAQSVSGDGPIPADSRPSVPSLHAEPSLAPSARRTRLRSCAPRSRASPQRT